MLDPRTRARFRRNRGAMVGLAIVALLVVFAVVGPWLAGHDPYASDFVNGLDQATATPRGPSSAYWLGTDRLYRDELSRLALGARLSLTIALFATAIASLLGALVGIVAGFYEGTRGVRVPLVLCVGGGLGLVLLVLERPRLGLLCVVIGAILGGAGRLAERASPSGAMAKLAAGPRLNADVGLMRLVDVLLSFPFLLLVMAVAAAVERTTATSILVVLGLTGWLGTARVLRAKTLQVRSLDYVLAARALGQRTPSILLRHVLPNVSGPLIVLSTVSVAQMIVAESVLSYLGAGISPPTPTWGHMLFEGQDYYAAAPWLLLAPGVAIVLAVFGFNLLGEGLRDALDPRDAS